MGADLETKREWREAAALKASGGVKSTATTEQLYQDAGGSKGTGTNYSDWLREHGSGGGGAGGDSSTMAVRYRGSTDQTRVGTDTRVRGGTAASDTGGGMGDADKGMAAAMKSASGKQFADSSDVKPVASKSNAWQGNRTPVNLASVQQRVLKSLGQ